jgi:hypothetical protein
MGGMEDGLLDALNFKPSGSSAAYVLENKKVKFFAEASDFCWPKRELARYKVPHRGPGILGTRFHSDRIRVAQQRWLIPPRSRVRAARDVQPHQSFYFRNPRRKF